jgi:hypothetical protein
LTLQQYDQEFDRLAEIYRGIMDVVADRLDAISESISEFNANPEHPHGWKNAEFCYLQVRKCVEYVALAVLIAHRAGEYECERLGDNYKADVIFNELTKLNQHGFPQPIELEHDEPEGNHQKVVQLCRFTKKRMKKIYDDCAVHLHAGRLDNLVNQKIPPYDFNKLSEWRNEIFSLLRIHKIMLPRFGLVWLVWLREAGPGTAKVLIGKAEGPFKIDGDETIYNDVVND